MEMGAGPTVKAGAITLSAPTWITVGPKTYWGTGVNNVGNVGVMSTGLKAMTPITLFSSGAKASIYGFAQYYYLKNDNLVAAKAILNSGENSRSHVVRSAEHTSELQSLLRISSAVFCLKKKNTQRYNELL